MLDMVAETIIDVESICARRNHNHATTCWMLISRIVGRCSRTSMYALSLISAGSNATTAALRANHQLSLHPVQLIMQTML